MLSPINRSPLTLINERGISVGDYPRLAVETDDSGRFGRALADAKKNNGGMVVITPGSNLTLSGNVLADPTNGSIVIEGGNSTITIATTSTTYGITIGQSIYNSKFAVLNNVTIQNVKLVASGNPQGGIYVQPGAFMPKLRNVKFSGFHNLTGAAIFVWNDGYNSQYFSWVDNIDFEDVTMDDVGNGLWIVGNTWRTVSTNWAATTAYNGYPNNSVVNSGGNIYYCITGGTSGSTAPTGTTDAVINDGSVQWVYVGKAGTAGTGQTVNENTFSQAHIKNVWIRFTQTGGHAVHLEGSFARAHFDGIIVFSDGAAGTDINTNGVNATSYPYFLKGNFQSATFNNVGAEAGSYVLRLSNLMQPDQYGDNTYLDSAGTWINTDWLNIPDSTRKLLKIIDPPKLQQRIFIDAIGGTREYRRNTREVVESGQFQQWANGSSASPTYRTVTITFSNPMYEVFDVQCVPVFDGMASADKTTYCADMPSWGVDSFQTASYTGETLGTSYTMITGITFYQYFTGSTANPCKFRFTVRGRGKEQWDYKYE